ncbi:D-alanyl-D-alanine carboxypeptidase [Sporichthya sp.]|uniref:D-alanyl-D-alanine carboxypeptidase family protein n=1 Tax=Sporichthya sp. TaxID=65475 RepID=UPI0025E5E5B3|nr:D-alanyl-D-alanine carboxypeptidase [Sporichthya sp.]
MKTVRRRRIGLGAAALGLVLPAMLASTAVAVDPLPTPSAGTIGGPSVTPSPTPLPPPATNSIGGSRMTERGIVVGPGAPAVPGTTAASWVVADADTGQVLAAKNPHGKYRPASTLKTLLALTMAPRLDPSSTIVADKSDENQEGTRVGMIAPQAYKVDDIWYGLLLRSGNDAANALARAGGGTVERGIRMMQAEAQRLQALDTTVVNPSGLDADGQFASAYDLALWGRAALQRRDLRHYVSQLRYMFPGNQTATATKQNSKPFWVYTENRLILQGFEGAIGVKTGYTTLAQNTLIAAAERNGRTIIATLMYTPFGQITKEAGTLLNWGFNAAAVAEPVGELVEPLSASVLSPEDEGFTSAGSNEAEVASNGGGGDRGSGTDIDASPVSSNDSLRWSAVAGSALVALLVLLGAARFLANKRRYRRYGAYRF